MPNPFSKQNNLNSPNNPAQFQFRIDLIFGLLIFFTFLYNKFDSQPAFATRDLINQNLDSVLAEIAREEKSLLSAKELGPLMHVEQELNAKTLDSNYPENKGAQKDPVELSQSAPVKAAALLDSTVAQQFFDIENQSEYLDQISKSNPEQVLPLLKAQMSLDASLDGIKSASKFLLKNAQMLPAVSTEVKQFAEEALKLQSPDLKTEVISSLMPLIVEQSQDANEAYASLRNLLRDETDYDILSAAKINFKVRFPESESPFDD